MTKLQLIGIKQNLFASADEEEFNDNVTWVNKNCKFNASNKRSNSNNRRVSLFWPTLLLVVRRCGRIFRLKTAEFFRLNSVGRWCLFARRDANQKRNPTPLQSVSQSFSAVSLLYARCRFPLINQRRRRRLDCLVGGTIWWRRQSVDIKWEIPCHFVCAKSKSVPQRPAAPPRADFIDV